MVTLDATHAYSGPEHPTQPSSGGHRPGTARSFGAAFLTRAEKACGDDLRARVSARRSGVSVVVNADLIAAGLSPFNPEIVAMRRGATHASAHTLCLLERTGPLHRTPGPSQVQTQSACTHLSF
jgi:hypothetical protein